MAAPAAGPQPTLASGAADAEYNSNLASIEHAENNLFGNAYGNTGEIGGELGKAILNTNQGMEAQVGANFARTGELGGALGRGQGERTRALSARAGANTQSGLYGTERGNVLRGFGERAAGVERAGKVRIEGIENQARKAWEKDQADRANAIVKANNRYQNYVARNPGPAVTGPPGSVGNPTGPSVTVGPGSPGQPIRAGFPRAEYGVGQGTDKPIAGARFAERLRPPPKPKGRR